MRLSDLRIEKQFYDTGFGQEKIGVIINKGRQGQPEKLANEAKRDVPSLREEDILRIEFESICGPSAPPLEGIMFLVERKPTGDWETSSSEYPKYEIAIP